MTRKQKRLSVIAGALVFLGVATTLTFVALGQKAGLVATRPGRDGRERIVSLTATGMRRAEEALPAWRAAQARVMRGE